MTDRKKIAEVAKEAIEFRQMRTTMGLVQMHAYICGVPVRLLGFNPSLENQALAKIHEAIDAWAEEKV